MENITNEAIELLKTLIKTQSFSREEEDASHIMADYLTSKDFSINRDGNNVWVWARERDKQKPTILFNSHIDTVKPSKKYTVDPFGAILEGDKLIGLGSNDAGGTLMSLMATFMVLSRDEQAYN